jgi:hypothetical protein
LICYARVSPCMFGRLYPLTTAYDPERKSRLPGSIQAAKAAELESLDCPGRGLVCIGTALHEIERRAECDAERCRIVASDR